MKTILNFFKNLLFDSQQDMIGLCKIKSAKEDSYTVRPQQKQESTLTGMLRRTY